MWVAISAVGMFETRDRGTPGSPGTRACARTSIPTGAVIGQCVHKLAMAAGEPEHLYQQNHCGEYRTFDGGLTWQEITPGLPSQFGFPMVAHPRDPRTVWTIPLNGDDRGRYMPEGRRPCGGRTTAGTLDPRRRRPAEEDAYLGVLREAMAVTSSTRSGSISGRARASCTAARTGRSLAAIAPNLPAIWSVEAVVV